MLDNIRKLFFHLHGECWFTSTIYKKPILGLHSLVIQQYQRDHFEQHHAALYQTLAMFTSLIAFWFASSSLRFQLLDSLSIVGQLPGTPPFLWYVIEYPHGSSCNIKWWVKVEDFLCYLCLLSQCCNMKNRALWRVSLSNTMGSPSITKLSKIVPSPKAVARCSLRFMINGSLSESTKICHSCFLFFYSHLYTS